MPLSRALTTSLGRAPWIVLAALALACAGCAGDPPPVVSAVVAPPERVEKPPEAESEIGGLNEEAVNAAFAALRPGVLHCAEQGASKTSTLGGDIKVKVRIDRAGAARWAYVSESSLGDRDTEKCVLALARAKTWPKPVGGDGLAESSFSIDATKEPVLVEEKKVARDVARARAAVQHCRRAVRGTFTATAHVAASGKVSAAGVSAPNELAEDASDCMVEELLKLRFRTGVGKATKLSFDLR
ncbi:MAG TPA: AgmX/PglI C-terminal domain-containing protein [Byssovorax sp.]|jgi:hypothetical protein